MNNQQDFRSLEDFGSLDGVDIGIYIHIPFCQVRCSYCDFNTYAGLGHLVNDYVAALCAEIRGSHPHPNPLPVRERGQTPSPSQGETFEPETVRAALAATERDRTAPSPCKGETFESETVRAAVAATERDRTAPSHCKGETFEPETVRAAIATTDRERTAPSHCKGGTFESETVRAAVAATERDRTAPSPCKGGTFESETVRAAIAAMEWERTAPSPSQGGTFEPETVMAAIAATDRERTAPSPCKGGTFEPETVRAAVAATERDRTAPSPSQGETFESETVMAAIATTDRERTAPSHCKGGTFESETVRAAIATTDRERTAPSPCKGEGWGEGRERSCAGTIYFGGGTPSLLRSEHLERILTACRAAFRVTGDAEITIEANPGTVGEDGLWAMRRLGINRLSLGVQSFDDDMLRVLDRLHNADQAREAHAAARRAGFDNVSLDFMYGLPGQTLDHWRATLAQAIALTPEHLSLYALTLEEHTPMAQRVAAGQLAVPDEDTVADMYALAEDVLDEAGYLHYEISNWASSQATVARHNSLYWRRQPYLGFGAGAHSFDGARRSSNALHPRAYTEHIQAGQPAQAESEEITPDMARAETMFLGLRLLQEGVSAEECAMYAQHVDDLIGLGLLERACGRVRLTRRGRLLSNRVFVRFL